MPPRPADPPPSPAQNRMPHALSGALDSSPSGGEASPSTSTHGEKLVPTRQDSYDPGFAEEPSGRQVSENPSSGVFSQNYASSDDDFDSDASDSSDEESSSAPSAYNSNTEFVDAEQQDIEGDDEQQVNNSEDFVGSDDGEEDDVFDDEGGEDGTKENPRYSPFPSVGLLVFLAVFIALSAIGLAAGLTVYLWQNKATDPIRPPDGQVPPGFETEAPVNPFLPSDERLMFMFSKVTDDALDASTNAGKAALWMLNEDPAKELMLPRSEAAWMQRYSLVYLYYETTNDRTSPWLSCNPMGFDADQEQEIFVDESVTTCEFAYPTELADGQVLYSPVPSHRWLSATDECDWGGLACGVTVTESVEVESGILSDQSRQAVTSIVLGGQKLVGTLPKELPASLPELQTLDLSNNDLEGSITDDFAKLVKLNLQYNKLQGTIPESLFSEDSVMDELNVGSNRLSGSLPPMMGLAPKLGRLSVSDNQLTGTIPPIGSMPLESFRGQNNFFVGILPFDYGYGGQWPETLKEWWTYNNRLSGSIPDGIGYISNLEDFRVAFNQLEGTLPGTVGNLDRLFRFDVSNNRLIGEIPEELGALASLTDVQVQFNSLIGEVPSSLCFLDTMFALEADCAFTRTEGGVISQGNNRPPRPSSPDDNDPLPVFGSIEEAVEAAREQEDQGGGAYIPPPPPAITQVQCYCCTKCCNQATGTCMQFASPNQRPGISQPGVSVTESFTVNMMGVR